MPSPLGHALGGVAVGLLLVPEGSRLMPSGARVAATLPAARLLAVTALAGALPDIDFLWGRHNMETHSLGAAALAGLIALAWTRGRGWQVALAVSAAWATHVLFDCLGSDDTPPIGVMALWPLTSDFYLGDIGFFDAISRRYWLPNFWTHNLRAVVKEALILLPLCALAAFSRALRGESYHVDRRGRPVNDGRG
jgi:hypothetical protein